MSNSAIDLSKKLEKKPQLIYSVKTLGSQLNYSKFLPRSREPSHSRSPREMRSERKTVYSIATTSQARTSRSYVRSKNLTFDIKLPEVEIKSFSIGYNIQDVIKKIVEYNMFDTECAKWVLGILAKEKASLLPKGQYVMSIPNASPGVRFQLLNLRNCVADS